VAFTLAPRLNAPGRLGDASPAVRALLAGSDEADGLAAELDAQNKQRQQVEKKILDEARALAESCADDPALVLWDEKWHPGVVGIVAGRLAAEFERPAALIALDGEEGRGSVRSVPGCNVVDALEAASAHLARYGGHREAAGLTVDTASLEAFREGFCRAVASQGRTETEVLVAAEADPAELSLNLLRELSQMEPFGNGNPEPLFLLRGAGIAAARSVGSGGRHLQLRLQKGSTALAGIQFGGGEQKLAQGSCVDIVTALAANTWQGRTSLSLHVRGLRTAAGDDGFQVIDCRGIQAKDANLSQLAKEQSLAVWVNTKAALEGIKAGLAGTPAQVTQLGRGAGNAACDALVFYHIPYDRAALEDYLTRLEFHGPKRVYLYYGSEELQLNERIFAASIPQENTLCQLAACLEKHGGPLTTDLAQNSLAVPVTRYLLARAKTVFAELGDGKPAEAAGLAENLHTSETYREDTKTLAAFRACQRFWYEADAVTIARYLEQPARTAFPEGDTDDESGRIKRAN
ncbi:MAG: DHHA1 domain-containing protein, partial [Bacillota bacterium]|nr:DHHA1 domain-containing protein [Bacillota bacterium]